jgi:glutamate/tyrosine decarboxylase-like PLP-dependent enzyme
MLKALGRQGVADMVERHCALTRRFADRLGMEPGINVRNTVTINQLIVDFGSGDSAARKATAEAVIAAVQAGGVLFAGGASWRGDWVMRLSVSSGETTEADIDMSADAIIAAWRMVQAGP